MWHLGVFCVKSITKRKVGKNPIHYVCSVVVVVFFGLPQNRHEDNVSPLHVCGPVECTSFHL